MRSTLLHAKDCHADYEAWLRQAAFIKVRRAALGAEACLVLDAGYRLDMSVDECWPSGGRLHLEPLAELGLDAFVPGNNEFYRAPRETLERLSCDRPFHDLREPLVGHFRSRYSLQSPESEKRAPSFATRGRRT